MKWSGRLEKNVYEAVVNSQPLGRARKIASARKWHNVNPVQSFNQQLYKRETQGFFWRTFVRPLAMLFAEKVEYPQVRNGMAQHGYTWDDIFVGDEKDLRRSPFLENVWRESTHPYQWLLFRYRRERFFKVDRVINGFEVPEWMQQESKDGVAMDSIKTREEWQNFVYQNYTSDMTPITHNQRAGLIPLELLWQYGILDKQNYERMFFNEEHEAFEDVMNPREIEENPDMLDLDTEAGRREFESMINSIVDRFPGFLVKEGEAFDFDAYYARRAIKFNKDTSSYSPELLEQMRAELAQESALEESLMLAPGTEDAASGSNHTGTVMNEAITPEPRAAFMH